MLHKPFPIRTLLRFERSTLLAAGLALFNHAPAVAAPIHSSTPHWALDVTEVGCALDGSNCAPGDYARATVEPRNDAPDLPGCRGLCNPFGQIPEFVAAAGMPPGAIKPPPMRAASPAPMMTTPGFMP